MKTRRPKKKSTRRPAAKKRKATKKKAAPGKARPAARKRKAAPGKKRPAVKPPRPTAPMFGESATMQVPVAEVLVEIEERMVLDQLTELPED